MNKPIQPIMLTDSNTNNLEAAKLHFQAGNLLKEQGRLIEATSHYQKALILYPNFTAVQLTLVETLLMRDRLEEAVEILNKVKVSCPELFNADLYLRLSYLLQERNQLEAARDYLRQGIAIKPDRADLHISLGNVLVQQRRLEAAIHSYQRAIALEPTSAAAHWQLSNALQYRAIEHQQKALDLQPTLTQVNAHFEMGIQFTEQGHLDWAEQSYRRAISLRPDWAEAHCNLGNVLSAKQLLDQAVRSLRRAIALNPTLIEAYSNLGNALVKQGEFAQALPYYQEAIRLQPDRGELHYNLADALVKQDRIEEALPALQEALRLHPTLIEAQYLMGKLTVEQGQLATAIEYLKEVIQHRPQWAEAFYYLGKALSGQGQAEAAIQSYERAILLNPNWIQPYWDLGFEFWQRNQTWEAIPCFQQILKLQPNFADTYHGLCTLLRNTGQFAIGREVADSYAEHCRQFDPIRVAIHLFKIYLESGLHSVAWEQLQFLEARLNQEPLSLKDYEIRLLYEELLFSLPHGRDRLEANTQLCRQIGQLYVENCLPRELTQAESNSENPKPQVRSQPSTLRIGVISKHLRRHPVGWCSHAILQEFSQLTPDLHLYYTGHGPLDDRSEGFRQFTDHFLYWPEQFPDRPFDLNNFLEQLQQDELDVLIDLDSVMNSFHIPILHQSPARICLSWLGCEAPYISERNYYLCDWQTHPQGVEEYYREQLLRMPEVGVAVAGFESHSVDRKAAREALGIASDQILYLSVATGHKINSDSIKAIVSILKQVPNSQFLHKGFGDVQLIQSLFQEECTEQNVAWQRCKFMTHQVTEEEHRTIYQIADVLLDTYPYNGGTHNLEALWFNLPIVTHTGEQGPARMGYSFLNAVKISEGIAWNWQEYIDWGVRLGQEADLRNSLQQRLSDSKNPEQRSPLWNPAQFARDAYDLFQTLLA